MQHSTTAVQLQPPQAKNGGNGCRLCSTAAPHCRIHNSTIKASHTCSIAGKGKKHTQSFTVPRTRVAHIPCRWWWRKRRRQHPVPPQIP